MPRVQLTLTDAEIAEADRQAEQRGLSRSAAIGRAITQQAPREHRKEIASKRRGPGQPRKATRKEM